MGSSLLKFQLQARVLSLSLGVPSLSDSRHGVHRFRPLGSNSPKLQREHAPLRVVRGSQSVTLRALTASFLSFTHPIQLDRVWTMAAVPIPAEHLADMGQRYGEAHRLDNTDWTAPLKEINREFAYNAPRDQTGRPWTTYTNFGDKDYGDDDAFKAAHFWYEKLDSALHKARLDHSAKRRAYNILSYLLHWDGANTIKHGFEARRREEVHLKEEQGKEHWRRLARMMVSQFLTCRSEIARGLTPAYNRPQSHPRLWFRLSRSQYVWPSPQIYLSPHNV